MNIEIGYTDQPNVQDESMDREVGMPWEVIAGGLMFEGRTYLSETLPIQ